MQFTLHNSLLEIGFTIFLFFMLVNSALYGMHSGVHGIVSSVDYNHIQQAIVEHLVLYPRHSKESDQILRRKGMLIRYPGAQATIVICHGFMCDRHDVGFLRKLFPRLKFNILTFDFRAHGEDSKDQYCTFGHDEAYDVIAAAQFVRNHPDLKDVPLYVYGFSMGAVSAIQAQELHPNLFNAMMLDCPFASSENVVKQALSGMKINLFGYEFNMPGRSLLEKYAFHPYVQGVLKIALKAVANMDSKNIRINIKPVHPIESMKKITVPCFFIHCKNDEKIPVNDVMELYNAAAGYKRLWITNGRRHYDSFFYNPEKYISHIRKFLNDVSGSLPIDPAQEIIIEH